MKIIFLDFDGVLNSTVSFLTHHKAAQEGKIDVFARPDASAVTLVNRLILADPSIRVVISSTWRNRGTIPELREILTHDFGLSEDAAAMVIDKTPNYERISRQGFRGSEIKNWLEVNGTHVSHYVILDDNSDMTTEQKEKHFVQTHFDTGFTWAHYQKAREILGLPHDNFIVWG